MVKRKERDEQPKHANECFKMINIKSARDENNGLKKTTENTQEKQQHNTWWSNDDGLVDRCNY